MVKHIVMWKLKDENKIENANKIKELLEALKTKLDIIKELEVGINENGGEYDLILVTAFDDYEDLKNYDTNEEHCKVKDFIKQCVTSRIAADYTVN